LLLLLLLLLLLMMMMILEQAFIYTFTMWRKQKAIRQ